MRSKEEQEFWEKFEELARKYPDSFKLMEIKC